MPRGDSTLDLEKVLYVLQKRDVKTREWVTQKVHVYRGRTDATTVLRRVRLKHPGEEWRSILKQEAERYREGWKDCLEHFGFGTEKGRSGEKHFPASVVLDPRPYSSDVSDRSTEAPIREGGPDPEPLQESRADRKDTDDNGGMPQFSE